jgi:calcineurin-like phosphoesterase family protein
MSNIISDTNFSYKNGKFVESKKHEEKVLKIWHTYIWKGSKTQFIPYLHDETDPEIVKNYIHWEDCYQCKIERGIK